MKICATTENYKQTIELINSNLVSVIIVGCRDFSQVTNNLLSNKELMHLSKLSKTKNKEIFVLINKMFFENEIAGLAKHLCFLNDIKINGIIFNDFAIKQICDENKLNFNLIYDSKNVNTNWGQLLFFKENNIQTISLSNELYKNEIKEISKNKNNANLMMQVEGYSLISFSRWKLLSNFAQQKNIKDDLLKKKLYIRENERKLANIIYETESGTYIFSGYNLSLIKHLDSIVSFNIDYIVINGFLNNEQWTNESLKIYNYALDLIKQNNFTSSKKNELFGQIQSFNTEICNDGFFALKPRHLHMEKKDE